MPSLSLNRAIALTFALLVYFPAVTAFPQYGSLAGLTREQVNAIIPTLESITGAQPPPPPLNDTSATLVNDADHPWQALNAGDIRGPCPGLNTLASHGWIKRTGVDTPANIINGVMNGFNMGWDLAVFITYAAMIVDGNQLTNLLSIGGKTPETGTDPPPPAIVGGLDTHAVFEGDASMTRGDFYFGNNFSFNETLFDELTTFANTFGGGNWNLTVATQFRFQRIQDSIATNPVFNFTLPRFITAYAEATFPSNMFVSGLVQNGQLDLTDMRGFFQNNSMPEGFFRRDGPFGFEQIAVDIPIVMGDFDFPAGWNEGVNNYIPQPNFPGGSLCDIYQTFVNETVLMLYPDPEGALRTALKTNLESFYLPFSSDGLACTQLFPYGQ